MIIRKFLIIVILICLNHLVFANIDTISTKNSLIIEAAFENGGIIADSELKNTTFEDAYYMGVNLRVGWRMTKPKNTYYRLYNYPIYGIGVYSSTFNNNIVGHPYAVYGYVQTPFGNIYNEKWGFDYRIGLGLSGNFKPFNEEHNPLNLALGTKNNVFIDLGIRTQYKFNNHFRAGLDLSFHHFSNGALRLPNKGVNLVPVTLSLTYQLDGKKIVKDTSYIPPPPEKLMYNISLGGGLKQIARDSEKRIFKTTLSAYVSKFVNYKWRLGGGLDLFYSASGNNEEIEEDNSGKLESKLSGGPAFYIVHVLNNNLTLNGNVGYYIHNHKFNGEINKIFLRAGFRYYYYKNLNAGVSIKAHKGQADYIEWTLGYTINR